MSPLAVKLMGNTLMDNVKAFNMFISSEKVKNIKKVKHNKTPLREAKFLYISFAMKRID